jgi:hypothetical protein
MEIISVCSENTYVELRSMGKKYSFCGTSRTNERLVVSFTPPAVLPSRKSPRSTHYTDQGHIILTDKSRLRTITTIYRKQILVFVFFLLGDSTESEFYRSTFRNTLPVPPINVGISNSDSVESPKIKNTTLRTRRKFEIKKYWCTVCRFKSDE